MKDRLKNIYQSLFKASNQTNNNNNICDSNDFNELDAQQESTINLREEEPSFLGLKRKYVYYVGVFLLLITIVAVINGLNRDEAKKAEREAKKKNTINSSEAVQGSHLRNIPKDYSEQAKIDEKKQKEAERKRLLEENQKRRAEQRNAQTPAPNRPTIPSQPPYTKSNVSHQLSSKEKALLLKEELRQKALVSPIGFDIKEK